MGDSVNIDPTVKKAKATFIAWASQFVFAQLVAAAPWIAWPVVSWLVKQLVQWIVTKIAESAEMYVFIANSVIKSADQAKDFEKAVEAKNSLDERATEDEIRAAEQAEMDAFRRLVNLHN